MTTTTRVGLARAVPTALLLAVTACTDEAPPSPSSPSSASASSASAAQGTPTATAPVTPSEDKNTTAMNIRLTIDGHQVDATLDDSATARDFAALLPLTLNLSDFHQTERIADLPRRLSTSGAPDAAEAKPGDLAYYAPWGNLALYYRGSGSSDAGLIILGRVNGDTERLATATKVTIEAAS
ncbi:cyclophilin-like fold protein [Streptomyces sp. NPDC002680]|uniref:cyclophilin-like fold protein n=1 Tax=Streptomyces sp. NPDC002680 TaxID=3364659 RepID=UPI00368D4B57